jgi:hypothetical protein
VGGLNRAPARVSAAWLAGAQVLSLRVSAEGARALLVVRDKDGRTRVLVTGIDRDGEGRPLALEPLQLDLLPDASTVVDAGWRGIQDVIVLAARPATGDKLVYAWQVTVGGTTEREVFRSVPADTVGLATGGDDVFLRRPGGKAYRRNLGSWDSIAVQDPALPG